MASDILNKGLSLNNKFNRRIYRQDPEYQFSRAASKSGSEHASIHSYVMERFEESRKAKQTFEAVWLRNTHFVLGHQWVVWSNYTRSLYVPPSPSWRVRLVVNEILPAVTYHVSQITKSQPHITVRPKSSEEEDVNKARLSDKFLAYLWEKLDMKSKLIGLATRMVIHGSAFLQPYWDPDGGESITLTIDDHTETIKQGDIGCDVYSAFEFYPDPVATTMEDVRYAIRARIVHVDTVKEMYPKFADKIEPESIRYGTMYQSRIRSIIGTEGFYNNTFYSEILPKAVLLREYMELPSSRSHKKGKYVVITDNLVLANTTLEDALGPSNYERLPHVKFDNFEVPDRFWGDSLVSQLIPVQQEINKTRSQELEIRNMSSKPKILVPHGSGIEASQFTTEPGEKIEYKEGKKPEFIWPQTPPSIYPQLIDTLRSDFNTISMIFDVQKGAPPPPSLRTAAGIAYLQEQGQSMLSPRTALYESNVAKIARLFLGLARDNYIEQRMISVVGENDLVEVLSFFGEDLNSFDVRVQPDSALPRLKAVKQGYIMNLLEWGLLPRDRPEDRRKILKLLDLGDLDIRNDAEELNLKRARLENHLMARGEAIGVMPHEDHTIHLEEVTRYMLTEDFYNLPPEIQQIFTAHRSMHEQYALMALQQLQAQQAFAQRNLGGSPGPAQRPAQNEEQQGIPSKSEIMARAGIEPEPEVGAKDVAASLIRG